MAPVTESNDPISDPVSVARPSANRAMAVALAVAFAAHAALLVGIDLVAPSPEPRPSSLLELMVVTEPGTESTASVPALVAAQDSRAGETQTLLPEIDASAALPTDLAAPSAEDLAAAGQIAHTLDAATALPPVRPVGDVAPEPGQSEPAESVPDTSEQTATRAVQPVAPLPAPISADSSAQTSPTSEPEPEPESRLEPRLALEGIDAMEEPEAPEQPEESDPLDPAAEISEPSAMPEPPTISTAAIFASRDAEMANLAARIQERGSAYASRTRRKAVSTATREYIYATYMEAWRRKVERIGNLNYPSEARELGLFGSLILHVAVRSDGSLEGIRVVRSSGHDVLDQAAIRIVELAAPFAPFPENIKRETDVLDITRTWQFQRNHELGWGR